MACAPHYAISPYEQPGLVSEQEALDVVQFASRYFSVIEVKLPLEMTGPMPKEEG